MTTLHLQRWPDLRNIAADVPASLVWAIGASMVIHVLLVAATLTADDRRGALGPAPQPLQAMITVPDITASMETLPVPVPVLLPLPPREALASFTLPAPPPAIPEPRPASPRRNAGGGPGFGKSVGALLLDRSRLGEFYDRGLSEFPVEISRPVRLDGAIVASYPAAALAAGREDSVVAWVVVDEQGRASEIEIPEGSDEFAEQVRVAIRAARFLPAQDGLKPIRFPIALQFDFRMNAAKTPGAGSGASAQVTGQ